jgi:hypothetical protein
LAAFLAVGDDSDLDLICGKAWHYDHILNASFLRLVGGEHPKPFLTIGAVDGEESALALSTFDRVNEVGRPSWRPIRLTNRAKERSHFGNRAVQPDGEILLSLFERRRTGKGRTKAGK